jgi:hypothetical protein
LRAVLSAGLCLHTSHIIVTIVTIVTTPSSPSSCSKLSSSSSSLSCVFPQNGVPMAHFGLARFYMTGVGVPKNLSRAVEHFTVAAAAGLPDAQTNLGTLYLSGFDDVASNVTRSREYFQAAAAGGTVIAVYNLGILDTILEPNCTSGLGYMMSAAYRGFWAANVPFSADHAYANYVTGHVDTALRQYMALAATGHPIAQDNAAFLLEMGVGRSDFGDCGLARDDGAAEASADAPSSGGSASGSGDGEGGGIDGGGDRGGAQDGLAGAGDDSSTADVLTSDRPAADAPMHSRGDASVEVDADGQVHFANDDVTTGEGVGGGSSDGFQASAVNAGDTSAASQSAWDEAWQQWASKTAFDLYSLASRPVSEHAAVPHALHPHRTR